MLDALARLQAKDGHAQDQHPPVLQLLVPQLALNDAWSLPTFHQTLLELLAAWSLQQKVIDAH